MRSVTSQAMRGSGLVEWLIAVPFVLLLGLGVVQWALIWQARHALEYAALRAVQTAATDHGAARAVRGGLSDGLGPLWGVEDLSLVLAQLEAGERAGWLAWERIGPPESVFTDFGEPALDANGEQISGMLEIPNDNLRFRAQGPGPASGLSRHEANQLSLRVRYGVPLIVPLVSTLIGRVMEVADGCAPAESLQLTTSDLGQAESFGASRAWACAFYRAPTQPGGAPVWRLPLQIAVSARMHSPLRKAGVRSGGSTEAPLPPERRVGPEQPLTAPERSGGGDTPDFIDWVDGTNPNGPGDGPSSQPGNPDSGHCEDA